MRSREERLRRLAINDARYVEEVLGPSPTASDLEPRVRSLVRLGALVAIDGPSSAFEWAASDALANGATADDIVDVLIATAPVVGSAHVVAAAPRVARALGYDVDADLEGTG